MQTPSAQFCLGRTIQYNTIQSNPIPGLVQPVILLLKNYIFTGGGQGYTGSPSPPRTLIISSFVSSNASKMSFVNSRF